MEYHIATFFKAAFCAILLSLPMGPAMVLCIRCTLHKSIMAGFVTGFGAALADAIYGFGLCYGLGPFERVLTRYQSLLAPIGGFILIAMAYIAFSRAKALAIVDENGRQRLQGYFLATFGITMTSPLTFLGVSSVMTALTAIDATLEAPNPYIYFLGMLFGGALFWALFSIILGYLKKKMTKGFIKGIIYFCSFILLCIGGFLLLWPFISH